MRIAGSLVAVAVLIGATLGAEARAQIVGPRSPSKSAIDPQVVAVIKAWGKHVSELQGFGFTVRATTQVKQGQQSQSQEVTTRITAERPNKPFQLTAARARSPFFDRSLSSALAAAERQGVSQQHHTRTMPI